MRTPREQEHRDKIKSLKGAVSISAAAWITEHYVKLHALGDSPIEPIRLEFMRFLGESLGERFQYYDTIQTRIENSPIFNGLIWPANIVPDQSRALLGCYTQKGNSQIWGLTSKYGEMNTTSIVFPIDRHNPEVTEKLNRFISDYRAKFSHGWSEEYDHPIGEGIGGLVTRVKTTP